jgi:xanthine dehydrogenase accessory factor
MTLIPVLVRGVGDVGSAVAHRLSSDGYAVVIHDSPQPTATRRGMAFADAVFDGVARLDGVEARRAADVDMVKVLMARKTVAVFVGPFPDLLEAIKPEILIDARMRKRIVPEIQRGSASFTIGLGPNFEAGVTCDVAIETSWDALGAVIRAGAPLPLAGEPRALGGRARDRYVYAPCSGVFRTRAEIGDRVDQGQPIAAIGETVLAAPVAGVLRGLTHDGVPVGALTKVIEVDPRGRAAEVAGISERPRRIAAGVADAVERFIGRGLARDR